MALRALFASIVFAALICSAPGCGSSENRTIPGLQEENKVKGAHIEDLKSEIERLRAENSASKATLKKEFEDSLSKVQSLNEQKVKHLEGRNASLMLELGSLRQGRLAIEQVIDQRPRVERSKEIRFGIERMIWIALVLLPLIFLAMLASKYRTLRAHLNSTIMRQAGSVRGAGTQQ
ncbi:MAG TPA: hypothetical protein VGP76_05015 [Planctomycetaceae bacterium]|jgi:hypothetical protein|nr:hypothetical protein [Planctomycetaceae bacterium]